MKEYFGGQRWRCVCVTAALFCVVLWWFVGIQAEGKAYLAVRDDLKVGDRIEVSVTGLEGDRYYEPCIMKEIKSNGYLVTCAGIEYMVQKAWVRRPKAQAPPPKADPPNRGNDDQPAHPPREPVKVPAQEQGCDFQAPAKLGNDAPFSGAVAKRKLYDNYSLGVRNGGTTSPLEVGVTFQTMQALGSFTNFANNRGFRINDAAPVNATIYRLHSKHIVCERYRNATLRRQVESNYACFKDRDGLWACGLDGIPKIVQMQ
jgi:hypothetical protein